MSFLPEISFLKQLADAAAAETMPLFRKQTTGVENKLKAGFDPVTEADRKAEAAIRTMIEKAYPDHGILGEEFGETTGDGVHRWVIDPIDGTRAFISGLPLWGTLVGLTARGVARAGFMAQPFTGELYAADGTGSFSIAKDGSRTKIAARRGVAVQDAIMFTTGPELMVGDNEARFRKLRDSVKLTRYGTDCYGAVLVACGYADLWIESGLQPYDVCALIPIIEQAGGVITTWDGGRAEDGGNVIAAGCPDLHHEAVRLLASA